MIKRHFAPFFESLVSRGAFREIPTASNEPRDFERCQRCTDPYASFVPPSGWLGGDDGNGILVIGEGPGENEDAEQKPFVGKAGQELGRTYLKRAGLDRNDYRITVTNVCKCRPPNNRTPVPSQIRSCGEKYLLNEIAVLQPALIVVLGNVALQFINMFTRNAVSSDPERLNLEAHHGFVFWRVFEEGILDGVRVFVAYHPAAGMRDGTKMQSLLEDMDALRRVLHEPVKQPGELIVEEKVDYREVTTVDEFEDYLEYCREIVDHSASARQRWPMGMEWDLDSEDDEDGSLFSVQISAAEGTAVMLDGKNEVLLEHAGKLAESPCVQLIGMHYSEHDWERVEAQLGWNIPLITVDGQVRNKVHDTLKQAFGLGNQPKKLKALAYRLCGVVMTSFHDLVYPYSAREAIRFLEMLAAHPLTQHYPRYGKKGQLLTTVDSNPLNAHVNRILRYTKLSRDNPDEDRKPYAVWDKWEELMEKETKAGKTGVVKPELAAKIGELRELGTRDATMRMPGFSIRRVPRNLAVYYGCKDADMTGRIRRRMGPLMDGLGKEMMEVADVVLKKGWVKG